MTDDLENTSLPVAEMAAMIGLRPRRLQYLVEKGIVPAPLNGRYDLVGVVQGYVSYLKDADRGSAQSAPPSRLQDLRATEIEAGIERRAERLKHGAMEAVNELLDSAVGGLKGDLLSIPARVTKDLPLRRRLETEIVAAMNTASARCSAQAQEDDHADRPR